MDDGLGSLDRRRGRGDDGGVGSVGGVAFVVLFLILFFRGLPARIVVPVQQGEMISREVRHDPRALTYQKTSWMSRGAFQRCRFSTELTFFVVCNTTRAPRTQQAQERAFRRETITFLNLI